MRLLTHATRNNLRGDELMRYPLINISNKKQNPSCEALLNFWCSKKELENNLNFLVT
jgi:hypothetical protein